MNNLIDFEAYKQQKHALIEQAIIKSFFSGNETLNEDFLGIGAKHEMNKKNREERKKANDAVDAGKSELKKNEKLIIKVLGDDYTRAQEFFDGIKKVVTDLQYRSAGINVATGEQVGGGHVNIKDIDTDPDGAFQQSHDELEKRLKDIRQHDSKSSDADDVNAGKHSELAQEVLNTCMQVNKLTDGALSLLNKVDLEYIDWIGNAALYTAMFWGVAFVPIRTQVILRKAYLYYVGMIRQAFVKNLILFQLSFDSFMLLILQATNGTNKQIEYKQMEQQAQEKLKGQIDGFMANEKNAKDIAATQKLIDFLNKQAEKEKKDFTDQANQWGEFGYENIYRSCNDTLKGYMQEDYTKLFDNYKKVIGTMTAGDEDMTKYGELLISASEEMASAASIKIAQNCLALCSIFKNSNIKMLGDLIKDAESRFLEEKENRRKEQEDVRIRIATSVESGLKVYKKLRDAADKEKEDGPITYKMLTTGDTAVDYKGEDGAALRGFMHLSEKQKEDLKNSSDDDEFKSNIDTYFEKRINLEDNPKSLLYQIFNDEAKDEREDYFSYIGESLTSSIIKGGYTKKETEDATTNTNHEHEKTHKENDHGSDWRDTETGAKEKLNDSQKTSTKNTGSSETATDKTQSISDGKEELVQGEYNHDKSDKESATDEATEVISYACAVKNLDDKAKYAMSFADYKKESKELIKKYAELDGDKFDEFCDVIKYVYDGNHVDAGLERIAAKALKVLATKSNKMSIDYDTAKKIVDTLHDLLPEKNYAQVLEIEGKLNKAKEVPVQQHRNTTTTNKNNDFEPFPSGTKISAKDIYGEGGDNGKPNKKHFIVSEKKDGDWKYYEMKLDGGKLTSKTISEDDFKKYKNGRKAWIDILEKDDDGNYIYKEILDSLNSHNIKVD